MIRRRKIKVSWLYLNPSFIFLFLVTCPISSTFPTFHPNFENCTLPCLWAGASCSGQRAWAAECPCRATVGSRRETGAPFEGWAPGLPPQEEGKGKPDWTHFQGQWSDFQLGVLSTIILRSKVFIIQTNYQQKSLSLYLRLILLSFSLCVIMVLYLYF